MTLIRILRICSVLLVRPTITENGGRIKWKKNTTSKHFHNETEKLQIQKQNRYMLIYFKISVVIYPSNIDI